MELGALFYPGHGTVDGQLGDHLLVALPFTVTEQEVDTIVDLLREAIRQVVRDLSS